MKLPDRQRGCLIGLAIGDALGAAVEFQPPGTFAPVTGYRAGGPHGLNPGEWTDDTSMALALADSMARVGWNLDDQARRYVSWWRTGEYSVKRRAGLAVRHVIPRRTRPVRGGVLRGAGCVMRVDVSRGTGVRPAISTMVIRLAIRRKPRCQRTTQPSHDPTASSPDRPEAYPTPDGCGHATSSGRLTTESSNKG